MSVPDVRAGPAPTRPLLVDIPEACEMLRVSRSTLYQLMDDGRLGYVRIGRCRRLQVAELQRLVAKAATPASRS